MKILFLHALADPKLGGGAEMTLWTLMRGMRDAGHECMLLATSNTPGLKCVEREGIKVWTAGIRNVYWPFHTQRPSAPRRLLWHMLDSYNPWMQAYIREVVATEAPDVASLHNLPGWSAASWKMFAKLGIPTVQVLHDYYPICVKTTMYRSSRNCKSQCAQCRIFHLPHRLLSRNVQAVVGVSRFMLDRHRSLGYFEGVPIQKVIHNARAPKALGIDVMSKPEPHAGFRFGYIGRLDPSKGIDLLIDAFLSADLPDAELWIAGNGKQDYEDCLHDKVSDKRIRLMGRIEARDFYPQVDAVVVPSLWNEPLGMVVAEALAFGMPVIGSRRGGIPEMIRHRVNGLLFEPDVPGDLKSALIAIHEDGSLCTLLAGNARSSSAPFIDMAAWVSTYELLYREMVEEQRLPPQELA